MNRRFLSIAAAVGGAAALLLGLAACGADVAPVEKRVGAVEQDVAKVKGDVSAVQGDVTAVQGQVGEAQGQLGEVQGQLGEVQSQLGGIGKIALPVQDVQFFVTAMEFKGSTSTKDLAPPKDNPADLSDGYELEGPGEADETDPTKWEAAAYAWNPAAMTVLQGDNVTLRIFVTNGNEHKVWIEAPDGSEALAEMKMNRGREYVVAFTADQVGAYLLHCDNHDPSMTGVISVLPRA